MWMVARPCWSAARAKGAETISARSPAFRAGSDHQNWIGLRLFLLAWDCALPSRLNRAMASLNARRSLLVGLPAASASRSLRSRLLISEAAQRNVAAPARAAPWSLGQRVPGRHQSGNSEIAVSHRPGKCRITLVVGQIRVGASLKQLSRQIFMAFACRHHQDRCIVRRPRVHIGATCHQ